MVVAVSEKQLGQSLEWPFQKSPCVCLLFVSIRTCQFWNLSGLQATIEGHGGILQMLRYRGPRHRDRTAKGTLSKKERNTVRWDREAQTRVDDTGFGE